MHRTLLYGTLGLSMQYILNIEYSPRRFYVVQLMVYWTALETETSLEMETSLELVL